MGEAGDVEEDGRIDRDGTGDTVMGGAPRDRLRDSRDREGDGRDSHADTKKVACGNTGSRGPCQCRHVNFVLDSYPKVRKDTIIQRNDGPMDAKVGRMDSSGDGRNEYQDKLGSALDEPQQFLQWMAPEGVPNSDADLARSCRISTRSPSLKTKFTKGPRPRSVVAAAEDPKDGHGGRENHGLSDGASSVWVGTS